jgi:hypothetical protein
MGTIGDYTIVAELASRPGVSTYEASHLILPRRARISLAHDRSGAERILREGYILEAIRHAGIPRVFDCGTLETGPWIATELVTGEPLPAMFTPAELAGVLRDVSAILVHVHRRGVIHDALWLDAIVRDPERGVPLCLDNWSEAKCGPGSTDIRGLGLAMYAVMALHAPTVLTRLIDDMLAPEPAARPTAAEVHAAASQIAELPMFSAGASAEMPPIEDVQLVVDLSA